MNNFQKEIKNLSTKDLKLILNEQQDYYSNEQIALLKIELASRVGKRTGLEKEMEQKIDEDNKNRERRNKIQEAQKTHLNTD